MRNNNRLGVSTVVSAMLTLLIVSSTVSAIVYWGGPVINNQRVEATVKQQEDQITKAVNTINNIGLSSPEARTVITISMDEGSYSVDEVDRTIYIFSYDDGYNFTVSGLQDSDDTFNLGLTSDSTGVVRSIQINIFDYSSGYSNTENINTILPPITGGNTLPITLDADRYKGTIYIKIYEQVSLGNLVGTIILADSNSLSYQALSQEGEYGVSIENGGITVNKPNKNIQIKNAPYYISKKTFTTQIIQMIADTTVSTNSPRVRLNLSLINNTYSEKDQVYFLKMKYYGDTSQEWINHLFNKYGQYFQPIDSNTLFFKPSDPADPNGNPDGVFFSLVNSVFKYNIY